MAGAVWMLKMLYFTRELRKMKNTVSSRLDDGVTSTSSSSHIAIKYKNVGSVFEQTTCRVCLKNGDIPIFGVKDLSEDLKTFAAIEVSEKDPYPKHLCASCSALLESAMLFRRTAQESDYALRGPVADYNSYSPSDQYYDIDNSFKNDQTVQHDKVTEKLEDTTIKLKETEAISKTSNFKLSNLKHIEECAQKELKNKPKLKKESCPICKKPFFDVKRHLSTHMEYVCDICGKIFKCTSQSSLLIHRNNHFLDDTSLPYECTMCPYKGRHKKSLQVHMRQHTGEKPYQCPQCPSKFTDSSNLRKHLIRHNTDFDFICNLCHRGFHKKQDMEEHFKVNHIGIHEHVCNLCGKAFGYRKKLMKHERAVHKKKTGRMPLYKILESKKQLEEKHQ